MKTIFSALVSFIAVGLLIVAPSVHAKKKPDGITPANEGVCNELKGSTPGLYGLCLAFCEAQDHATLSSPITEEELEALKDNTPSGRILANYNKKKQSGDPDMPCVKVEEPCPCWDNIELDSITNPTGSNDINCFTANGPNHNGAKIRVGQGTVVAIDHQHETGNYGDDAICIYEDFRPEEDVNISRIIEITPDELTACDTQIRQKQTDFGLICRITD